MQIGELAQRSGASRRSLRHYELAGLIEAHRRGNGYREYDDAAVEQVVKIKALLGVGLSIAEIKPMLSCVLDERPTLLRCARTIATVERTVADLDRRIDELRSVRSSLTQALPARAHSTGRPR